MSAGLLAEFSNPEQLIIAYEHLRKLGYRKLETFTPYPMEELKLPDSVALSCWWVAATTLFGSLAGAVAGYLIQWWASADFPLRVGAMPVHAWPAFIPITFETSILCGTLAALLALAKVTGLPRWWDEMFTVSGFERASIDRFFLLIDSRDLRYSPSDSLADCSAFGALRLEQITGGP